MLSLTSHSLAPTHSRLNTVLTNGLYNASHVGPDPTGNVVQAQLERVMKASGFIEALEHDGRSLKGQGIKPLNELLQLVMKEDDPAIRAALKKERGYLSRLSSKESWDEWLEWRTQLGRVVILFKDFTESTTPIESFMKRLDLQTIHKAAKEAQQILDQLAHPQEEARVLPLAVGGCKTSLVVGAIGSLAFQDPFPIGIAGMDCLRGVEASVFSEVVGKPVQKGLNELGKVLQHIVDEGCRGIDNGAKGLSLLVKNSGHGLDNLYKFATGKHKLSLEGFRKEVERGRENWREELGRAPKPIRLVNEAIRGMIEDDLEGTVILLGSFVADAYAPGSGQMIRQAYTVHQLAKSGVKPDAIVKNILEGNAEQILTTVVNAYAPEYKHIAEGVVKTKKARDLYKNNEDVIKGAMRGDKEALGLFAQKLIVMHPEITDKFDSYGITPQDIIGLEQGDIKAARSLVMAGMKMSVDSVIEASEAEISDEMETISEGEILEEDLPEGSTSSSDDSAEVISHLIEEELIGEMDEDITSSSTSDPQKKWASSDNIDQTTDTQKGNEFRRVGDKLMNTAKDQLIEKGIDDTFDRIDDSINQQADKKIFDKEMGKRKKVTKDQKAAKNKGQAEGKTKKEIRADKKVVRKEIETKTKFDKKRIEADQQVYKSGAKGTKRVLKASKLAFDLADDPESTVIEKTLEFIAKSADKIFNQKGKLVSKLGGPISILTDIFSSEELGDFDELGSELKCEGLGFRSNYEYNQWLVEEAAKN